ncbi:MULTISPECIES: metal ABC transporter ATP-binding protein [Paenibacillus]|uniref:ATP-binding cassette domain-containing protein n=1 Tax=Paenibacillus campinasensis TaxID=66347 RepID=A0ABW9T0T5_9BACL|nr:MULTISPECIES: metal ABC transporter ATP-binding protein [Paenibacillus]MUG66900.1 ATP-binding cassette domain-containing protein [Paenibacillus campinasensis]PAK55913.1 zinc ABC transporter ATP-binding protein [Paenibacillus sp. 7541]
MILSSMQGVVFGYGDEAVIENLTLDIYAGQFTAISGPNGAAKSTMLKLMLGLIKPWRGTARFTRVLEDGTKLSVGYVPQQVASFNAGFPSKVIELVRSGRYNRLGWFRRFTARDHEMVERSLKEVGMWEYRNRRIGELSGGQKQRICMARALAQEPHVLILDEPTTGLDAASRADLYRLLSGYVKEQGKTVIMVTHSLEEIDPYVDRIVRLERKENGGWQCSVTNSCSGPLSQEA